MPNIVLLKELTNTQIPESFSYLFMEKTPLSQTAFFLFEYPVSSIILFYFIFIYLFHEPELYLRIFCLDGANLQTSNDSYFLSSWRFHYDH